MLFSFSPSDSTAGFNSDDRSVAMTVSEMAMPRDAGMAMDLRFDFLVGRFFYLLPHANGGAIRVIWFKSLFILRCFYDLPCIEAGVIK